MRFETAVSALLSANYVIAERAYSHPRSSLEEASNFRRLVANSIADANKGEKEKTRLVQEIQKHRNDRVLRDYGTVLVNQRVKELSRKLSDVGNHQEKRNLNGAPNSDSNVPDFGILASSPNQEQSNQKHRGNSRLLRNDGAHFFHRQAKELAQKLSEAATHQEQREQNDGESDVPDFGILASAPTKDESTPGLQVKNKKASRDDTSRNEGGTAPDIGNLSPTPMEQKQAKKIKNKVQNLMDGVEKIRQKADASNHLDNGRRLEDYGNTQDDAFGYEINPVDFLDKPLVTTAESFCSVGASYCQTCEITNVNEDIYNFNLDCSGLPDELKESIDMSLGALHNMCATYTICDTCFLDYGSSQLDLRDCSDGGSKFVSTMIEYTPGPLSYLGAICNDTAKASLCETCDFAFLTDAAGYKTMTYNLRMDCPNYPKDALPPETDLANYAYYCEKYKLCDVCTVDTANLNFYFQNCNVVNMVGLIMDSVTNIDDALMNDDDSIFGNLDDMFGNIDDIAGGVFDFIMENGPLASFGILCDDVAAEQFCNSCELTYSYDQSGYKTGYDLKVDCPSVPQELRSDATSQLIDYCTGFNLCTTCNGDAENFYFDFQDCNGDAFLQNLAYPSAVQAVATYFDSYFAGICDSTCASCDISYGDSSSLSLTIDCPTKLSASNGFGYNMILAQTFCSSPEEQGLKCSTCDVDPWASTININDCVAIADLDQDSQKQNSTQLSPNVPSDEDAFLVTYQRFCNPASNYLQDVIATPNCDCRFNATTQTVSFSCLYQENCREISSYCPEEPIVFCDTYRIDATNSKSGMVKLNRCVNFTSPYQFSYCVSYGSNENATSGTTASDSRVCEMEVDGVQCNECNLVQNDMGMEGLGAAFSVDVLYNCSNTVIGTNGPGNLSQYNILDDTVSYFIYQSLPCFGGCDLCGVGSTRPGYLDSKTDFMTKPDGTFSSEFWKEGKEQRCFDAQLGALTLDERILQDECAAMRKSAREPCGCENRIPRESGAHYLKPKSTSTTGVVILTVAAVSFAQMLFG